MNELTDHQNVLTVVKMKTGEVVLAVVIAAVDDLANGGGNALQDRYGIEEHLAVLICQGADFSPHILHLHRKIEGTREPRGIFETNVGPSYEIVCGRLLRVEDDYGALPPCGRRQQKRDRLEINILQSARQKRSLRMPRKKMNARTSHRCSFRVHFSTCESFTNVPQELFSQRLHHTR